MFNIKDKVEYYVGYETEWSKEKVLDSDFQQLEELLDLKLPTEYKEFMKETNGLYLDNAYFYFEIGRRTKYLDVRFMFSFCENVNYAYSMIKINKKCLENNALIPNYVVVGGDGIGYIIYNVETQKVQYWDGILVALSSEYVHIIDLADSLEEFIEKLEPKRSKLKLVSK